MEYVKQMIDVFGNPGMVAFAWAVADELRSEIYKQIGAFPILNLFGPKMRGKTSLAFAVAGMKEKRTCLNVFGTTVREMSKMEGCVILDEFTNSLPPRKMELIKAQYNDANAGIILCGRYRPTNDVALFERTCHVPMQTIMATPLSREKADALEKSRRYPVTQDTFAELKKHIDSAAATFERNLKFALKTLVGEEGQFSFLATSRTARNWAVLAASFRSAEDFLPEMPFDYTELITVCGMYMFGQFVKIE